MELASLFLVRINLFFPFPVQWALICHTLQRLGQMTLAKGLDEQFWYKSDMKRLERIWIRWSTGERNPHLMLINVYACGIHLKHISIQKQAQCIRTKYGLVHGLGTGTRMAFHMPFLNWILWKCGIDNPFKLTMINYKTLGQRNANGLLSTNSGTETMGRKKRISMFFIHRNLYQICTSNSEMKERPITSPRPWSHAFIYHQSALLLSLCLSKPGCMRVFMNALYYFSLHSCFFLPTPANISSFLWITLLYSLMHVISMPRCYLISQQSSFGVEWAEQ